MTVTELMGILLTVPMPDVTEVVIREVHNEWKVNVHTEEIVLENHLATNWPTEGEDVHLDGQTLLIVVGSGPNVEEENELPRD